MKLQFHIKRLFDLSLSFIGLLLLLPIFIVISFIIKFDSKGPVFFKQKRLGKNGNEFNIYKLRTMVENAENIGNGIFTGKGDSRITRVGKILRKTSLDELPQLINVFKGEMSLVGPRPPLPHYPKDYDDYSEKEKLRFKVLPGVTGYAQVNGRQALEWPEKIKYDIEYVKKFSLWLDLKILFKTIIKVFKSTNVHKDEIKSKDENKNISK